MKKSLCFSLIVMLVMSIFVSAMPALAESQRVVNVSSAQELVNAIASDTKIIIQQGNYLVPAGRNEYGVPYGIKIENISNLTIQADGWVDIQLDTGMSPVFEVIDSNNISFIGLSAGHNVPEYGCEGDGHVIWLENSQNITIDNCDLWGCGIMGVISFSSGNVNITNTTIRDCALYAIECFGMDGDIVFDNCKILRNTYYAQAEAMDWTNCFNISYANNGEEGKIIVKNSEIVGNYSSNLYNKEYEDRYEFIGCSMENNRWDGAIGTQPQQPGQEYVEEYPETIGYVNENIISVSGITGYDESRTVMYDNVVAICSAPVVIETKTDLNHISIVKLAQVNGEWVDARYFDGFAINYGDISKNWMPAEGFENVDVDLYEFTGGDIDITGEDLFVGKGKKITLSEKGMYQVWADAENGDYTGLTFEIVDNGATYDAKYTDSKVMVDGREVQFEAYNIADNNYFKLRDIAMVLSGTSKQFEVEWDEINKRINMISFAPYTAVGGELAAGDGVAKTAINGTNNISKDFAPVSLKAYMINGNNYFKLRDLGKLFDFDVSWDGENNCVIIDSESYYTED